MAATCEALPPISERTGDCGTFSKSYSVRYFGKISEITLINRILRFRFGQSSVMIQTDKIPDWLNEGIDIELEMNQDGAVIQPLYSKDCK